MSKQHSLAATYSWGSDGNASDFLKIMHVSLVASFALHLKSHSYSFRLEELPIIWQEWTAQLPFSCSMRYHALPSAPNNASDSAAMSLLLLCVSQPCHRKTLQDPCQAHVRYVMLICFMKYTSTFAFWFRRICFSSKITWYGKRPAFQTRTDRVLTFTEGNWRQLVTKQAPRAESIVPCVPYPIWVIVKWSTLAGKHRMLNSGHSK